ncbi:MAG: chemotaxis protein CheB, partial [bacterium]
MAPNGEKKPVSARRVDQTKPAESEKGRSPSRSQRAQAKTNKESFYIVGIGASAGGLEAFEQFFTHMPETREMAFILVPHLDPTHKSIMPDLL